MRERWDVGHGFSLGCSACHDPIKQRRGCGAKHLPSHQPARDEARAAIQPRCIHVDLVWL
ncbi:hypothetical protein DB30_08016 [Enhygromyxa salina]|uniref:Uncharacterized protein n=1 Tax=Enhygromyxa salina TaxID=215803 RepID=A0A0C1Z788_9BACT|nr:hypothetical protein DB30_08016 [Enhygromyxa salina]